MVGLWILIGVAAASAVLWGLARHRLGILGRRIRLAGSELEARLQDRHALVVVLVEASEGSAPLLIQCREAWAAATRLAGQTAGLAERAEAENRLTMAVGRLLDRAECLRNPEARGRLAAVAGSLKPILDAQTAYNQEVFALNQWIHRFPGRLVARGGRPVAYVILEAPASLMTEGESHVSRADDPGGAARPGAV